MPSSAQMMMEKIMDYSQAELEARAKHASKILQSLVNGFNRATKGEISIIKRQTAESLMKEKSEELKKAFMSIIDLS
jgi:hypothetical protein